MSKDKKPNWEHYIVWLGWIKDALKEEVEMRRLDFSTLERVDGALSYVKLVLERLVSR